jgi:predicted O-linked N-acetylglucosamine transferase (SPINDLY family)
MNTDADLQQAEKHHRAEQFVEAEQLYRAILATQPDHADANHNLGILAVQLNQVEQSLPFFEAALAARPDSRDFWAVYVDALILAGQTGKAEDIRALVRRHGIELGNGAAPANSPNQANAQLASEFIATLQTLTEKGLHDNVEPLARQMVQLLPNHGFGWKTLAYARLREGDLAGALAPLTKAATLLPQDAEVARHYRAAHAMREGLAMDEKKDYANAGKCFQAVLEVYPNHPEANHKLGAIGIRLGQAEAAILHLERALGSKPNDGQYWVNYIDALVQSGQIKAAWAALEMAQQRGVDAPVLNELIALMTVMSTEGFHELRVKPAPASPGVNVSEAKDDLPDSLSYVAAPAMYAVQTNEAEHEAEREVCAAHFNEARVDEALAAAHTLAQRYPNHGFGWKMIVLSLHRLARYDEALEYVPTALRLWPFDTDTLQASASINEANGKHKEAEADCRRLLEIDPNHLEGLRILAIVLMSMQRVQEAEVVSLKVTELAPDLVKAKITLGALYVRQGRLHEACEVFRRAIELDPDADLAYNNLAFAYTTMEDVEPAEVFAEHRRFGEHFEKKFKPHWPKHTNSKDPGRRLRIGFISGDFCNHAVSSFIEPVLQHLSRDESLTLHAFSNTSIRDHVTERISGLFAHWHHVFGMTDDKIAELVRANEIDILIDLAGHSANNRLLTLARKPAPVQASWIGYPGTTGMNAVDYFLADHLWLPAEFRNQFTEKIAYLPAVAPFLPDRMSPPVNMLPATRNGYVTFGSFNRVDKLRREVIALWAEVMRAVPNSRILMGAMPKDGSRGEFAEWFAEEGITEDRLMFRTRSSVPVYLQQHHHVDLCFDSFPFSGLTTVLHSLWMGVPTLTLPGNTVPGRSGLTAMSHVGLPQFVAQNKADFVRKGVALASDIQALAALRDGMRERCKQSPMFRPEAIAQGASKALRVMWQRWCDGLPAESFDVSKVSETADVQ